MRRFTFLILLSFPAILIGQEIHFRYNLTGYHSEERKIAFVLSKEALDYSVDVIEENTGHTTLKGLLKPAEGSRWGNFPYQYDYDFSDLSRPGVYRIKIGKHLSPEIRVAEPGIDSWLEDALGFLRQQRCGYNPYFDVVCHQWDGRIFDAPVPDSTYYDFTGGWHDAGDQLKYLITSSNAIARLLMSYQFDPEAFLDQVDAMGHPSPNGIPDVLDEAKWGLDWILKLHPKEDWLVHQIADDRDHRGFKFPHKDNAEYGWGPNSYRVAYFATGQPQGLGKWKSQANGIANLAGRSAAALALGARIWKAAGIDDAFALRCKTAALELYQMGKEQEGFQQGNSYGAPYRYNENTWTDDMEWAAAELYKLTGDTAFLQDAIHYALLTKDDGWMARDTMLHYELYPFYEYGPLLPLFARS
jgi:endoglucanase